MNGRKAGLDGLAHARKRIDDLVIDLDRTVDEVIRLTDQGDCSGALRLLDEKRDELVVFVDGVARDIAAPVSRRRILSPVRAVIAIVTVIAIAAGIGIGVRRNSASEEAALDTRALVGSVPVAAKLPRSSTDTVRSEQAPSKIRRALPYTAVHQKIGLSVAVSESARRRALGRAVRNARRVASSAACGPGASSPFRAHDVCARRAKPPH